MSSTTVPLLAPMNLSRYQSALGSLQQQPPSHNRQNPQGYAFGGSPALGNNSIPIDPALVGATNNNASLPNNHALSSLLPFELPTSAPPDSTTFPSHSFVYATPPQAHQQIGNIPRHPSTWPGAVRPTHQRAQTWTASTPFMGAISQLQSLPQELTPALSFASPAMSFVTPSSLMQDGGNVGLGVGAPMDAFAYATYPYPNPNMMDNGSGGGWIAPKAAVPKSHGGAGVNVGKVRKHVCPVCDKRFNRPSSLSTHMAVHTGAKPYICTRADCGRRFSVGSNLRRHEKTHDTKPPQSNQLQSHNPNYSFQPFDNSHSSPPDMHSHSQGHDHDDQSFLYPSTMPFDNNDNTWQSGPLSSGLSQYQVTKRRKTSHNQPTTPPTPPILAFDPHGQDQHDYNDGSKNNGGWNEE